MTKIYGLFNPETDELRYVGKTVRDLKERLNAHIVEAKRKTNYKCRWINSIAPIKPIIELLDEVQDDEWEFWEQWYIQYFKGIGCKLTNICIGGEHPPIKKSKFADPIQHRKEQASEHKKKKYVENKEEILRRKAIWRKNNQDKIKAYTKRYSEIQKERKQTDKYRAYHKEYMKKYNASVKLRNI